MHIITPISAIVAVVSVIVFFTSLISNPTDEDEKVQVGDVFSHWNPGTLDNPNEQPSPWVGIYIIEEIQGEQVKVKIRTVGLYRDVKEYEVWRAINSLKFDQKIK